MAATIVLGLSIILQLIAVVLALRLVVVTRGRVAWQLIAAAILLMAVRRGIEFTEALSGQEVMTTAEVLNISMTFAISALLLVGLATISPLFVSIMRNEDLLRQAHSQLERRVAERTAELARSVDELKREVASRKQAEDALRESEERYRRLFATELDAIMLFDAETRRFIDVNESAVRLYGYDRDEFMQLTADDLTAEQDESGRSIEQTLSQGTARILLRYHRKKDGSRFPVEISSSSFQVGGRRVICGAVHDITKRVHAEEALRVAHRKLIGSREEERLRLSRELHDSVGQQLVAAGLKLKAHAAEVAPLTGRPDGSATLADLMRLHRALSEEVRRVSHALYPQVLEEFGLAAGVRQLKSDMASEDTSVSAAGSASLETIRFARDVEIAFYRIAQEALSNALRHSKCRHVWMELGYEQGTLSLMVMDDGVGFDPENTGDGLGLSSMRERAEAIGAIINIDSRPGQTCIGVSVPVEERT